MSDIATYLSNILNAIRGEDVRQSIHDAIQACYEDGQAGATDLTARQQITELQTRINNQYPVGSIFISTSSTNPSETFGGTWTQIAQGRTLIGVGSIAENTTTDYGTVTADSFNPAVNERGGEVKHTLTVAELPSHRHTLGFGGNVYGSEYAVAAANPGYQSAQSANITATAGSDTPHNNMMPYLAVYIWERTA